MSDFKVTGNIIANSNINVQYVPDTYGVPVWFNLDNIKKISCGPGPKKWYCRLYDDQGNGLWIIQNPKKLKTPEAYKEYVIRTKRDGNKEWSEPMRLTPKMKSQLKPIIQGYRENFKTPAGTDVIPPDWLDTEDNK